MMAAGRRARCPRRGGPEPQRAAPGQAPIREPDGRCRRDRPSRGQGGAPTPRRPRRVGESKATRGESCMRPLCPSGRRAPKSAGRRQAPRRSRTAAALAASARVRSRCRRRPSEDPSPRQSVCPARNGSRLLGARPADDRRFAAITRRAPGARCPGPGEYLRHRRQSRCRGRPPLGGAALRLLQQLPREASARARAA